MLSSIELHAISQLTTDIYHSVCEELNYTKAGIKELALLDCGDLKERAREMNSLLDRRYEEQVCKLDSRFLELILLAHQQGSIKRAQATIQAITSELMERELLNEGDTQETE